MSIVKKLFITDWLMLSYILFFIIWIIIGRADIEGAYILLLKIFGILVFIFATITLEHFTKNSIVTFTRYWYPIILLEFFYVTTTAVDNVIFKENLDLIFQHLDEMIFGYQPALVWGTTYNQFFFQEFFHFAYFSYYLMIFGVPFYIYLKEKKHFIRALFNILFVFVTCYIVFMILPVVGARMIEGVKELTETYRHGFFTHIMVFIYRHSLHWGGAFPSSHVAVALTIALISFRYFKLFSIVLLVNTFFLSIATVFCHYHYFVDVIAGVVFGLLMFFISEIIYAIFGFKQEKYIDT